MRRTNELGLARSTSEAETFNVERLNVGTATTERRSPIRNPVAMGLVRQADVFTTRTPAEERSTIAAPAGPGARINVGV